jgi:hypothetical protein
VLGISIADSFVAEVFEHPLHCLRCIDSLRDSNGLGGHVLDGQDVHLLVFIPQVLAENVAEGLGATIDWQSNLGIVGVSGAHVNDSTLLRIGDSLFQIWTKELGHEHEWETVHVDGLDQRLIGGFVELGSLWISLLDIVDQHGDFFLSTSLILDTFAEHFIVFPL